MEILDVHVYRDGGTVVVDTDQGKFWLPKPSNKDRWPRKDREDGVDASREEVISLLQALAADSSSYQWIKRNVNNR